VARGFTWSIYIDDDGFAWALKVDSDQALDPTRGWSPATLPAPVALPRGWRPREVYGFDADGNRRFTRVGTVTCDLWTGVATAFTIEANDNTDVTVTVVGKRGELRRGPSAA
jgi:hypothetical protein